MTCWGPPKGGLHRPPSSGETTSVENSERLVRVGAALAFLRRSVGPVEKLVSNLPQIYRERLWRELPRQKKLIFGMKPLVVIGFYSARRNYAVDMGITKIPRSHSFAK